MKTRKCAELQSMWSYRKKQKEKVAQLESLRQAANDGAGLCLIQEDAALVGHTEQVSSMEMVRIGTTGHDQTVPGIQGRV